MDYLPAQNLDNDIASTHKPKVHIWYIFEKCGSFFPGYFTNRDLYLTDSLDVPDILDFADILTFWWWMLQ